MSLATAPERHAFRAVPGPLWHLWSKRRPVRLERALVRPGVPPRCRFFRGLRWPAPAASARASWLVLAASPATAPRVAGFPAQVDPGALCAAQARRFLQAF